MVSMVIIMVHNLVGGDWNHGIFHDFPETVGNKFHRSQLTNSLTHSLHHNFQRGIPYTTKQLWVYPIKP